MSLFALGLDDPTVRRLARFEHAISADSRSAAARP
jgi:hypothetical protein